MAKENNITFSIIIPLHIISQRFFEDLRKFQKIKYPKKKFEILLVTDKKFNAPSIDSLNISVIQTKKKNTGPAKKRDIALQYARGEYCAFIDDDAYPDPLWLKNAEKAFLFKDVVAVGGPGVTPPEDEKWEQISGLIYESYFCSGATQHRFTPQLARFVEDFPAYNLIVRTSILKKVGGYGNDFYGGEDTFLCTKLIRVGKIYYEPTAVVYHHRRKLFFGLIKQVANIGLHRGYFAKKYPKTSRLWFYFLPSILAILFFSFLIISIIFPIIAPIFFLSLSAFVFIGALSVWSRTTPVNALFAGIGIIVVHISYGSNFIRGLFLKNLKR